MPLNSTLQSIKICAVGNTVEVDDQRKVLTFGPSALMRIKENVNTSRLGIMLSSFSSFSFLFLLLVHPFKPRVLFILETMVYTKL